MTNPATYKYYFNYSLDIWTVRIARVSAQYRPGTRPEPMSPGYS